MQVTELTIRLQGKYDEDAGQYRGIVTLVDEGARNELKLSSKAISAIFALIKSEAEERAKDNARRTSKAMEEAVHGPLLLASE